MDRRVPIWSQQSSVYPPKSLLKSKSLLRSSQILQIQPSGGEVPYMVQLLLHITTATRMDRTGTLSKGFFFQSIT